MRNVLAVGVSALVGVASAAVATGQSAPRLEGTWSATMRFTVAEGLRDRRVGQRVVETWRFRPSCERGACDVVLRRAGRAVRLRRDGSTYRGRATFAGSVTCNDQTFPTGTVYVETWTVRIVKSRGRRATRIAGTGVTTGRSRTTLPCAQVSSREVVALTASRRS